MGGLREIKVARPWFFPNRSGPAVWTGFDDKAALEEGIRSTYQERNLRFSRMAQVSMFEDSLKKK